MFDDYQTLLNTLQHQWATFTLAYHYSTGWPNGFNMAKSNNIELCSINVTSFLPGPKGYKVANIFLRDQKWFIS